jgi:hypothetical protein
VYERGIKKMSDASDHVQVLQTAELAWETWYPQFVGTKCKTIFDDETTGESLRLAFVPSEFRLPQHTRHHHGTTREFVYVIFGDLPYVEYETPTAPPRDFTFEQGMLLDRPPHSIHGMGVDPVSQLGALLLEWTTGPNDFNIVPFEGAEDYDDGGEPFGQPWVADLSAVAWEPHPSAEDWSVKVLSAGRPEPVPGFHPVCVVHIPGTWPSSGGAMPLAGRGQPWCYVLDGTGRVTLTAGGDRQEVDLEPGTWIRWSPGATIELSQGWTEDVGLTLLCAGSELVGRSGT